MLQGSSGEIRENLDASQALRTMCSLWMKWWSLQITSRGLEGSINLGPSVLWILSSTTRSGNSMPSILRKMAIAVSAKSSGPVASGNSQSRRNVAPVLHVLEMELLIDQGLRVRFLEFF